ncbi:helix-turn-helix domain-containing protein [Burkholderia perseverans]|uniref:helix-turn-helix domain-containing protein n=1 Tax=Burkholderia perseverans TaxID=2615214 RepID=UPI001FEFECBB|nr:helix-turn-helix domain-containing protein [Burkholderia perseverans]
MTDDILTTAEAAKLLGVSIRTVQLWVEGGTLASWKTPGGHRRVRRASVEAAIRRQASSRGSALVVVIAARPELDACVAALAPMPECVVDAYHDPLAAMRAIGARPPFAIVVAAESLGLDEAAVLHGLLADARLAHTTMISIHRPSRGKAAPGAVPAARVRRLTLATAAQDLPACLRERFEQAALPAPALPAYSFPVPVNEAERLAAVERSGLAGSPPDEAFDRLTRIASQAAATPFALVTLLTRDEQVFKSRVGLPFASTPRDWAFCNYTILQRGVFAVSDLSKDARFAANPGVAAPSRLRFYAGAPIFDARGFALGSLCVMDTKPRRLSAMQQAVLFDLAAAATDAVAASARRDAVDD